MISWDYEELTGDNNKPSVVMIQYMAFIVTMIGLEQKKG